MTISQNFKFFGRLIMIFTMLISSFSYGGDFGLGGGKGKVTWNKVTKTKKTPLYYFFLDEVARIGDFGTGGGVSSRWKKMKSRLDDVLRGTNKNSRFQRARAHDGERFIVTRMLIPASEFNRFELGEIVTFIMKDEQKITPEEIESIQVRRKRPDNIYLIRDLNSFKINSGEEFKNKEIAAIEVLFQIEEKTSSSSTKPQ